MCFVADRRGRSHLGSALFLDAAKGNLALTRFLHSAKRYPFSFGVYVETVHGGTFHPVGFPRCRLGCFLW